MNRCNQSALSLSCTLICTVIACKTGASNSVDPLTLQHYTLRVTDSIGIDQGDSLYVFGSIFDIENGADGSVFVLDVHDNTVKQYDSQGKFVMSFGGTGSGPGELNIPGYFTVTATGNPYVIDGNFFVEYLPDGSVLTQKQLSQIEHPQWVESVAEDSIVGILSEYLIEGDTHSIVNRVALWRNSCPENPEFYYCEMSYSLSVADFRTDITRITYFPILFACGTDVIYIALDPVNSPMIFAYHISGAPVDTIVVSGERGLKTDTELTNEKIFIEHAVFTNSFGNASIEWEPDPYRPYIRSLGVDSVGNLWIQRGSPDPVFDLVNADGIIFATANVSYTEADSWHFEIDPSGITAFDMNPHDYQKVYFLDVH